jgi:hypothetical protein
MNDYRQHKLDMDGWLEQLHGTIEQLERCELFDPDQITLWRQHLQHARASLLEPLLRVAVVGAVKSGKSTLINALAGCDLLKRGAGITTAFITRILTNEQLSGWIEFKSWPQVSREIHDVLRLLAARHQCECQEAPLDLRRAEDFRQLSDIRDEIRRRLVTSNVSMDPNFILLNAYLQGYPLVHEQLTEAVTRLPLAGPNLHEHRRYVGQEAPAIFLQDIELHIPVPWLGNHLELADCQGSDSPNPLHFASLQNYLSRSHFIVYLISGRTGLREADYRLLDFCKSLHMLPRTLFILNIDLDSHPDADDLHQLVARVRTELDWFVPQSQLFAFSALYHLVEQVAERATDQDQRRRQAWRESEDLASITESGFGVFRETLADRVDRQRHQVLVGNAVSRAAMLAGNLDESAATLRNILSDDQDAITRATRRLRDRRELFSTTLTTLRQAIHEAQDRLQAELEADINQAFDLTSGPLVLETLALLDQVAIDPKLLKPLSGTVGVVQRIHDVYLQFRQDLWGALVEKINVKLLEFSRNREEWLQGRLHHAAAGFWSIFATAMEDYRLDLAGLRVPLHPTPPLSGPPWPELGRTSPPQFSAFVQRAPLGRPVLVAKFGLGRLSQLLIDLKSRLGRHLPIVQQNPGQPSLDEALALVKSETRTELLLAFREYLQALKHGHFFRLLDEECRKLLLEFQAGAELAQVSFSDALQHGARHQEQRQALEEVLIEAQRSTREVREGIETIDGSW